MNNQTCCHSHNFASTGKAVNAAKSSPLWRDALLSLAAAASRVHHYRDIHTRMVRESLEARRRHLRSDRCHRDG